MLIARFVSAARLIYANAELGASRVNAREEKKENIWDNFFPYPIAEVKGQLREKNELGRKIVNNVSRT